MGKWSKIEALLDKAVEQETKRILAKAKAAMGLGNGNGHTKPIEAKRRKASTKVAAARKLHGQYLGLTRGLGSGEKVSVKKIRAEKGVKAAIAEARRYRKLAAGA